MGVEIARFLRLLTALPGTEQKVSANYTSLSVHGRKFGYLWPRTRTVGLKQTISEQLALVAERPKVFEVQFTTGGVGPGVGQPGGARLGGLGRLGREAWRPRAPEQRLPAAPAPHDPRRGARPARR